MGHFRKLGVNRRVGVCGEKRPPPSTPPGPSRALEGVAHRARLKLRNTRFHPTLGPMRLVPILFLPLSALASPPLDGPAYECERAVVRGEPGGVYDACGGPGQGGDMAALAKAKAADELSRNQASASAALVAGLRAAERARRAAPGRVVEEALLQHA
jgi:hypothetical protein